MGWDGMGWRIGKLGIPCCCITVLLGGAGLLVNIVSRCIMYDNCYGKLVALSTGISAREVVINSGHDHVL